MSPSEKSPFVPVSEDLQSYYEVSSCIEILGFPELMTANDVSTIQVFYERIGQEIYAIRKKNYSWGFRVIEPQFINFAERLVLVSKLYEEEDLKDLNSIIFKLFAEFNNIIVSTAMHMHLPIRGKIRIGKTYRGEVRSKKPAVMTGKDPLILSDLLKVFTIGEIFPSGFSEGLIPAVDIPFHFGEGICQSFAEITKLESIGIFMSPDQNVNNIADVTILSGMMSETKINGKPFLVCNWKKWMSEHSECYPDNVLAFAENESTNKNNPQTAKWRSLLEYSSSL